MSSATPEDAKAKGLPEVDVNEYGGKRDGERQKLDRRLFMQLIVIEPPLGKKAGDIEHELRDKAKASHVPCVVYADTMNPTRVGLLTFSEKPEHFVDAVRPLFADGALATARVCEDYGMIGRTYSTGHEPDLEHAILRRSIENVMHESYGWHVWYPLRRKGAFAKLEPIDQSHILREHAALGMAYGQQELAHDIRLACHGLDARDNEFVIGLVGRDLHPLSHLVQAMRKTRQTSEFIAQMGPFFVGRVLDRVRP